MIIKTKTLTYDKTKGSGFSPYGELREQVEADINKEFNEYFGNNSSKYDGTKVARTSYFALDKTYMQIKNSQVIFEFFEIDSKKVLEKMVINIIFKEE